MNRRFRDAGRLRTRALMDDATLNGARRLDGVTLIPGESVHSREGPAWLNWLEQGTLNPKVAGSSPAAGTTSEVDSRSLRSDPCAKGQRVSGQLSGQFHFSTTGRLAAYRSPEAGPTGPRGRASATLYFEVPLSGLLLLQWTPSALNPDSVYNTELKAS